jgi:hypothetical protein
MPSDHTRLTLAHLVDAATARAQRLEMLAVSLEQRDLAARSGTTWRRSITNNLREAATALTSSGGAEGLVQCNEAIARAQQSLSAAALEQAAYANARSRIRAAVPGPPPWAEFAVAVALLASVLDTIAALTSGAIDDQLPLAWAAPGTRDETTERAPDDDR